MLHLWGLELKGMQNPGNDFKDEVETPEQQMLRSIPTRPQQLDAVPLLPHLHSFIHHPVAARATVLEHTKILLNYILLKLSNAN